MRILAAKQVGEVSYFVEDIETLYNILKFDRIKYSRHKQNNTSRNTKDGSVSLSRSMYAAPKRNPNKWVYGVILDGNKLSDRYHIEPYHYLGSNVPRLLIKSLTRYTNNVCVITFANWPNRNISTKLFDYLEDIILDKQDYLIEKKKLSVQTEGKRKVNGAYIDVQYKFNVKSGDGAVVISDFSELPEQFQKELFNSSNSDEFEEVIWKHKDRSDYIDISRCIIGIIVPKSIKTSEDSNMYNRILKLLDDKLGFYDTLKY